MARSNTVALMTALVVFSMTVASVAVAPVHAAETTQSSVEVADGHTGSVDPGRENNEEQQYPLNFSVYPTNRAPGSTDGGANYFAEGMTEDIRLHWIVVESEAFDFSSCEPQDASAFGIDRGNDNSGTQTDKSLLTSFKSYESTQNKIKISYYDGSGGVTAGEPVTINVEDQIVAAQRGCLNNPKQKGWYRVTGKINGSTKKDATTDYTINAGTQYIYVCDCESREEAREKLGPPPNEEGESTPTASPTPKSGGGGGGGGGNTATPTASPTPKSGGGGGGSTTTATATTTSTANGTTTSTANGTTAGTATTGSSPTPTSSGTTATGGSNPAGGNAGSTPTENSGPGFGLVAALGALLASGAVAIRRRD